MCRVDVAVEFQLQLVFLFLFLLPPAFLSFFLGGVLFPLGLPRMLQPVLVCLAIIKK